MENLTKKIKTFKFPEIKYSKVIELLEELNKQNREKYEKWLYMRKLTDKILRENSYRTYVA